MIRKWYEFIKESIDNDSILPGPEEDGSIKLKLTDDEEEMFSSEPALENLISNGKVSLFDNEVWYFEDDTQTINILKEYFPNIGKEKSNIIDNEDFDEKEVGWDEELESVIYESLTDKKKNLMNKLTEISKKRKKLDKEYDNIIKEIHKIEDKIKNKKDR